MSVPATAPLLVVIAEGSERRRRLARALENEGFVVTAVPSAADAERVFASVVVDGIVDVDGKADPKRLVEAAPTAVHLAVPRAAVWDDEQEVAQVVVRVRGAMRASRT